MYTRKDPVTRSLGRILLIALSTLAVALPAASMNTPSMNNGATVDPPLASTGQRALIEAHDTAGVGWWSSPALEMEPASDADQEADAPSRPQSQAPMSTYPRRAPGVESR
jgi:hypothetical protein